MGLWVREGRRRWQKVRGLPPYQPPVFLRITPAREGPPWWLSWTIGPDFGADALPELLEALLQATSSMPGKLELKRVHGQHLEQIEGIEPFPPQAVLSPGLLFQKVGVEPARWLLTIYLARSAGKILVAEEEKYLGGWWASLLALKRACQG
ncbi:MAG: hypothetical protein ACPLRP_00390 [Candidatus Bipolaricaulaceae bacterium]